jgi:formylglycine-generating enzyme required for sulfatase activity
MKERKEQREKRSPSYFFHFSFVNKLSYESLKYFIGEINMQKKIGALRMRALGIAVLVTACTFGFAACGDGNDPGGTAPIIPTNPTITSAPKITTATLKGGTVDKVYSYTLTASGDAPITWSLDGGTTLPAGLVLAAATGVIAGTPKTAGTTTFTVKAANADKHDTKVLSITITKIFSDSDTDFEMAWMNSGTFTMGSPTSEEYRETNETQHSVTLTKGFYMGIYPVTQAQYEAVMESNPSAHRVGGSRVSYLGGITDTTNFPVDTITWYNALVFCNKLSMLEGLAPAYSIKNSTDPADWGSVPGSSNSDWYAALFDENSTGYRLPTDAQWEYACRAGTTTAFNTGNTISDNTGWYSANSGNRTHSVGEKPANAWGLYDMHGNVEEWCWDRYDHNYGGEAGASATDPTGADSGGNRVARGGSWYASWTFHRSAYRDSTPPYYATNNTYGLRIVRPAE